VPNQLKIYFYLLGVESDKNLTILKSTTKVNDIYYLVFLIRHRVGNDLNLCL